MSKDVLQTPLEVLLFFTTLATHGVQVENFTRISEQLRADEFIKESEGYDERRLSPESLQKLYVELLREEVKGGRRKRSATPNGDVEENATGTRKRKLSTPPLQSLKDIQEHSHLLPQLINRLYARYRDSAISSIREYEERHDTLQGEIVVAETERVQNEQRTQVQGAKHEGKGSISTLLRHDSEETPPVAQQPANEDQEKSVVDTPATSNVTAVTPVRSLHGSPAPSTPILSEARPERTKKPDLDAYAAVRPPSQPGVGQPPLSPRDATYRPPTQYRLSAEGQAPYLPPLTGHGTPSTGRYAGRPPAPMTVPSTASPPQGTTPVMVLEHASQSPIILPPIPSMSVVRSMGSPTGPLPEQIYRSSPVAPYGAMQNQPSMPPYPHPFPQPRNYQQPPYGYQGAPPQYSPHYQPYNQAPQQAPQYAPQHYRRPSQPMSHYPLSGSVPFPHNAIAPGYGQPHPPPGQYGQYQPIPAGQHSYPATPQAAQTAPPPRFRASTQFTPVQSSANRRSNLAPLDTSVSSTRWKKMSTTSREVHKSPTRPELSPYLPSSPEPEADEDAATPSRKGVEDRARTGSSGEIESTASERPLRRGRGGRRGNLASRRGRGRARSGTVSTRDHSRTASPSIASQAEDVAHSTRSRRTGEVKSEPGVNRLSPSAQPSRAATPVDVSTQPTTRTRRGTFRSTMETPISLRRELKRKRGSTLENTETPEPSTRFGVPAHPTRPNHILASRTFNRTSSTIMHELQAHKLASMFAKPITEREAPGYRDIVYKPQDFKSIRGLIAAGSRAVAAATERDATEEVEMPGGTKGGGVMWLERSAEVMPPKAIVNSSQLEKEICRVFANSVMFNADEKRGLGPAFGTRARRRALLDRGVGLPGTRTRQGRGADRHEDVDMGEESDEGRVDESGFVRDAREMFADVDQSVTNWRAAERQSLPEISVGSMRSAAGSVRDKTEDEEGAVEDGVAGDGLEEGESGATGRRREG